MTEVVDEHGNYWMRNDGILGAGLLGSHQRECSFTPTVQCSFIPTEIVGTIRDGEPRLLSSVT